ncbi:hypothetical protein DESA109040_00505 [Deinococcus saxicola]|uniref:hypothetical protein n=1 Tax=Deinococcus saxicola TaxID=249406 RepID=UPI0039EF472D
MHFNPPDLDRQTWHIVVEFRMDWHVKSRQKTLLMFFDRRQAVAAVGLKQEEERRLRSSGCYDLAGRLVDSNVSNDFYLVLHEAAWNAENIWCI